MLVNLFKNNRCGYYRVVLLHMAHACVALVAPQQAHASATGGPCTAHAGESEQLTDATPDWARWPRFMGVPAYVLREDSVELDLQTAPGLDIHDIAQSSWRSAARLRASLGGGIEVSMQAHSLQPNLVAPLQHAGETLCVNWAPASWGVPTNPVIALVWQRLSQNSPNLGLRLALAQSVGTHVQCAMSLQIDRALLGLARAQHYAVAAGIGLDGWADQYWPVSLAFEASVALGDRSTTRLHADSRLWTVGPSVLWRAGQYTQLMASVFWLSTSVFEHDIPSQRAAIQPTLRLVIR